MQISGKPKTCSCIFIAFLKSTLNFEQFEKNESPSLVFLKLLTPKDVLPEIHERYCF